MTPDNRAVDLTDLVDGTLAGPEWDAWLAEHPAAAVEVAAARRVRALMRELAEAAIVVPDGFEERLLARLRQDRTLLDLLDLGFFSAGRALIELLNVLLSLLPTPPTASSRRYNKYATAGLMASAGATKPRFLPAAAWYARSCVCGCSARSAEQPQTP